MYPISPALLGGSEVEVAKYEMEKANAVVFFVPCCILGLAVLSTAIVASFARTEEIVNTTLLTLAYTVFVSIRLRVVAAKAKRAYEAALSAHESSPRKRNAPTRLLYLLPSKQKE